MRIMSALFNSNDLRLLCKHAVALDVGKRTADRVLTRWRQLSATLGRKVRVEVSGQITEGIADDIGSGGELIVDGVPFVAGSVIHL